MCNSRDKFQLLRENDRSEVCISISVLSEFVMFSEFDISFAEGSIESKNKYICLK